LQAPRDDESGKAENVELQDNWIAMAMGFDLAAIIRPYQHSVCHNHAHAPSNILLTYSKPCHFGFPSVGKKPTLLHKTGFSVVR
jgi:hypothetical protein